MAHAAGAPLAALHRFEFGDHDGVVAELESLVEARATALSGAYGISCVLV